MVSYLEEIVRRKLGASRHGNVASMGGGREAMPEVALKVALVIFVAKQIDPIATLPALVAGYFCRTWWQVVIAAAAVGIIIEMILVLFQQTPEMNQGRLLMGVLAAGVWSNLAFAFKIWLVKRVIGES
jgi:hypothetical protein